MKLLSVFLVFGGYLLVYSSLANKGRFATEPWQAVFQDAYTSGTPSQPGGQLTPGPATGPNLGSVGGIGAGTQKPTRPRKAVPAVQPPATSNFPFPFDLIP